MEKHLCLVVPQCILLVITLEAQAILQTRGLLSVEKEETQARFPSPLGPGTVRFQVHALHRLR